MAFTLNIELPRPDPFPVEREAERLTWIAWRRHQQDRLFGIPELKFENAATLKLWDRAFAWRAVGVVAPINTEDDGFMPHPCAVGLWIPNHNDHFGSKVSITLRSLHGGGSTLHRSPLNVGFVHILPTMYQRYAERFDEEPDDSSCGNCPYMFKDDEDPCPDCRRCANCCFGQGHYGEMTCLEADRKRFDDYVREQESVRAA